MNKSSLHLIFFLSSLSLAAPDKPEQPEQPDQETPQQTMNSGAFGLGFDVSYTPMTRDAYQSAFNNNGLGALKSSGILWGFQFYFESASAWRFGGHWRGHQSRYENGSNVGTLGWSSGALAIAKKIAMLGNLHLFSHLELGGGEGVVEIFSSSQDGRTIDEYFLLEPGVSVEWNIFDNGRLTLGARYFYPSNDSRVVQGDDLGLSKIVSSAWIYGIGLNLHWGGEIKLKRQTWL